MNDGLPTEEVIMLTAEVERLLAEVERLRKERDDARDWIKAANQSRTSR